jgi:chromatin segregation and condensation protein Rec8/ScpA/Scc1 (kleisin family)
VITLAERAAVIRSALGDADAVVLQELLRGVRDRVVVAVTFLAMLELVKRREIVVEQAEPWGPIVARNVTPEERAAAGIPDDDATDEPLDESLESFA